jgi:FMN phosphatase YigB (HAD superfamily)
MVKKIAVFDLDGTLGDFAAIDFFSYIYDVEAIINNKDDTHNDKLKEEYKLYSEETKHFLNELKNKFEEEMIKEGYTNLILRPDIVDIFKLLNHKVRGCIIYSNNGNLFNLEFAARAIQNLVNNNNIIKTYIHRFHSIRDEFDGAPTGYRTKTVNTIKKVAKKFLHYNVEASNIIFFDDIIHPDLMYDDDINYVLVNRYDANLSQQTVKEIFYLFESILYDLFKKYKTMGSTFFDLYHIKHYLGVSNLEHMEEAYHKHSKITHHSKKFTNDYHLVKKRIEDFIQLKEGGKRKCKTFKNIKGKTKKRRLNFLIKFQ